MNICIFIFKKIDKLFAFHCYVIYNSFLYKNISQMYIWELPNCCAASTLLKLTFNFLAL